MPSADTSWLYALIHQDDQHHAAAQAEAKKPEPLLVNPAILVEFLDLVRDKLGHDIALAVYADLMATPTLRLVAAPKPASMARVVGAHPKVSWQDASAICTALDEGAGLNTFDKDQRKAFDAMK